MNIFNKMRYNKHKSNYFNGSVIILAIILSSILLTVGMGISSIALKEIRLSSIGEQSGKAFYMADTGAECALYWDSRSTTTVDNIDDGIINSSARYIFSTSSLPGLYVNSASDIKCFGGTRITSSSWSVVTGISPDRATTTFTLMDPAEIKKPCAVVTVFKRNVGGGIFSTTVDSRGRSSCDPSDKRRVERGLRVSY